MGALAWLQNLGNAGSEASTSFYAYWIPVQRVEEMKKNTASQIVGMQMVNASTGAAFTGSVTVYVTGDGGTQAVGSVGSGACTHEGNGYHTYAPAQAETNYDQIGFTFIGTGAVPQSLIIYTSYPQTGDNYARLGAPAGASVSADIATITSKTNSLTFTVANQLDANIQSINDVTIVGNGSGTPFNV